MVKRSKKNNKLNGGNPYIGREISSLTDINMGVRSISFHPTEPILVTAGIGLTAQLWRLSDDNLSATYLTNIKVPFYVVLSVAFHPTVPLLATGSACSVTKLWRLSADNSLATCVATLATYVDGNRSPIRSVAFHPTAPLLATTCFWTNVVKLWRFSLDNSSSTFIGLLRGHSQEVYSVAFHPSGQFLATTSLDKTVKLWRLSSDDSDPICIATLTGHFYGVTSVAFHPSGHFLATGSWDTTVKLWSLERDGSHSKCIDTFQNSHKVNSVAFHPNGIILAIVSEDKSLKLLDCSKLNILLWKEALTRASLSARVIKDFTTGTSDQGLRLSNAVHGKIGNTPDTQENKRKQAKIISEKYKGLLPREPISSTPTDEFIQCDSCRANDADAAAWAAVDPEYRVFFNQMSKSSCAECPSEATEADTDKMPGGRRSRKKLNKRLSRKLMIR